MAKIGNYDYPDVQLETLLKALEILVKKFNGHVKDEKTFAEAIGHSTNNSGGFIMKLSDLRKYGFIDKKGLVATVRGKSIINFLTTDERNKELSRAIMGIKLWKDLYSRLETKTPSSQDFRLHLVEITQDRDKAINQCEKIRNIYVDAMNNFTQQQDDNCQEKTVSEEKHDEKTNSNLIYLSTGEVNITLPRNNKNIDILISVLNSLKENDN